MLVPAPVSWFGSLPGAVLSGSAQKVPKDAAWRGAPLIAPAIKATPSKTSPGALLRFCGITFPSFWKLAVKTTAFLPRAGNR